MNKILITLLIFISMGPIAFSQTAETKATSFLDDPLLSFYILVICIFVIALLVLLVAIYMLQVFNAMVKQVEREKAIRLGIEYEPSIPAWLKLWHSWNALRPMEKEADIMMDHNYDGIRELDNHLPPWWKLLFYSTIGFAVVYLLIFQVFDTMPNQKQEYDTEVAYAQIELQKISAANPVAAIDENTVEVTTNELALADGKQTFLTTCASCHRKDGGGDIGPNLTDEYWLHGGFIVNVFKVVKHGVPGTNMIAWDGVISPEKMRNVASYVLTLQGSNPINPKRAQGNLREHENNEMKSDSLKLDSLRRQTKL